MHRYNELRDRVVSEGVQIIKPLAIFSKYGMALQNRNLVIRQLIDMLHRHHSDIIRAIAMFDDHNQLIVTSNYPVARDLLQLAANSSIPDKLTYQYLDSSIVLRMPIISERYSNLSNTRDVSSPRRPIGYVAMQLDLQPVWLQQYKEVLISLLMLGLSLGIAMLFAYRLMREVTEPIRHMVHAVDHIRRGQLDNRVEGDMPGELNMLKNGINAMAMSLSAYHEEMQQNVDQATSDLRQTLDQMEIQNVELDLAKKRAQQAVRIKSEILANMSHELRTPLNGVIGFTRQILKTPLNATQRDYLHTIERSANNLLSIISDVLDFSKLEAGKLVLESIPFSLRSFLDDVIVLMAQSAHDKKLELTLLIQPDVPDNTIGDPLRLQQVIVNLVGNAIKFTKRGNIDIQVEKISQSNHQVELEIKVNDTGIGIAEEQQSQLFQAFRQADSSTSRRYGGTGLGLVITQHLVVEMGGKIGFHSRLNQGSTFWFQVNLNLNPNALSNAQPLHQMNGKRLGYVEANAKVAIATTAMLKGSPVEISHAARLADLDPLHYDNLLIGVPVETEVTLQQLLEQLSYALTLSSTVIMLLPCQPLVHSEILKNAGATACFIKSMTLSRLIPVLLSQPFHQCDSSLNGKKLPLTVMAVDDNPANLRLIGELLEEQITHPLLCESGQSAVRMARLYQPDIILMDIQMPEVDGIRASMMIREQPYHRNTPIIAVSAHAIKDQYDALTAAGIDDYLTKPIDEQKLSMLLARYIPRLRPHHTVQPSESLDWSVALRQAANKPDLARDMLRMLVDFLPEVQAKVEEAIQNNDITSLKEIIHKLHGSSSYSGAVRLKQLCQQIEKNLDASGDIDAVKPELLELIDETVKVTSQAARFLDDSTKTTARY